MTVIPGWATQLLGERRVLDRWRGSLPSPFDPHLAESDDPNDSGYLLRSQRFAVATDASEVRREAIVLLQMLNGALSPAAADPTEQVRLGWIVHIDDLGIRTNTSIAEANISLAPMSAVATAQTLGHDGQPLPPPPPTKSRAQVAIEQSACDDIMADLLRYAAKADNWYDVFRFCESVNAFAGSNRVNINTGLLSLLSSEANRDPFVRLKDSAGRHRHRRVGGMSHPMTFAEAQQAVKWVLDVVLRTKTGV